MRNQLGLFFCPNNQSVDDLLACARHVSLTPAQSFMIEAVKLEYEITLQEFLEMAWLRHRSSIRWIFGLCMVAVLFASGIFLYVFVAHDFGFYLMGLSGLLLVTLFVVTSLSFRRVYRRNSRMFGQRTVTVTETGFVSDHPLGHSEAAWNRFEKFRETARLFLLYQSADLISILPKRVFTTPAELEQFRSLLTSKVRPHR